MNSAKVLLICGGILSLDMSLFQAGLAVSPGLSAAFQAPPDLVSNPPLLLAAGILVASVMGVSGLYGLSAAGLIRRLPLLRLGLVGIGAGYLLMALPIIPQVLILTHVLSTGQLLYIEHISLSLVTLVTGLAFLIGLALNWRALSGRGLQATGTGCGVLKGVEHAIQ